MKIFDGERFYDGSGDSGQISKIARARKIGINVAGKVAALRRAPTPRPPPTQRAAQRLG